MSNLRVGAPFMSLFECISSDCSKWRLKKVESKDRRKCCSLGSRMKIYSESPRYGFFTYIYSVSESSLSMNYLSRYFRISKSSHKSIAWLKQHILFLHSDLRVDKWPNKISKSYWISSFAYWINWLKAASSMAAKTMNRLVLGSYLRKLGAWVLTLM